MIYAIAGGIIVIITIIIIILVTKKKDGSSGSTDPPGTYTKKLAMCSTDSAVKGPEICGTEKYIGPQPMNDPIFPTGGISCSGDNLLLKSYMPRSYPKCAPKTA